MDCKVKPELIDNFRTAKGLRLIAKAEDAYGVGASLNEASKRIASGGEHAKRGIPPYFPLAGNVVRTNMKHLKPLLIVGAERYLADWLPFELPQAWKTFVFFTPTSEVNWLVSLCALHVQSTFQPIWVNAEHKEITEAMRSLLNVAALIYVRDLPKWVNTEPYSPAKTAWLIKSFERMPKIALTDILHLGVKE